MRTFITSVDIEHCSDAPIASTIETLFRGSARAANVLLFMAFSATAAPVITQTSSVFDHHATVTIAGTGFGPKVTAAPIVWDDASGATMSNNWDGAWPDCGNPAYAMRYYAPMRGISLPHSHVSKYIAGAHGENGYLTSCGATGGPVVIFWKNRTISLPAYTYAAWYQRFDNAWVFNPTINNPPNDNNLKVYDYSVGGSPMDNNNRYVSYGLGPTDNSQIVQWTVNDDGASMSNPDINGHNYWWGPSVNPMAGQWSKIELAVKITNQNDGYIMIWENGALKVNYVGPTDKYPGTARNDGIGGYARAYGSGNNWRYFADVYLDYTLARVVLANSPNLGSATIVEPQIPSTWTGSAISITVNLGKFSAGQTAYLFVVDSTGVPSAAGFPVAVGGTATQTIQPPPNLRVQ